MWVAVVDLAYSCYKTLVVTKISKLYLLGPSSLGFWAGEPKEDICSHLTGVPSQFWQDHPDQCHLQINTHFQTFMVLVETCFYFYCFCSLLRSLVTWRNAVRVAESLEKVRNWCVKKLPKR